MLAAGPSLASPPSPATSTVPCGIVLAGVNEHGLPDPAAAFTVVQRNIDGSPTLWPLVLDLSGCPEISVCAVRVTPAVDVSCDPATRRITFGVSPYGQLTITLIGSTRRIAAPATSGTMQVYAGLMLLTDGFFHPPVTVAAFDQTGGDGLTMADFSLVLGDEFDPAYHARSDFDHGVACQSLVSGTDLSLWLTSFFNGYVRGCDAQGAGLCP